MKQDGTLGKKLPVITLRIKYFLRKYQKYVWYQDEIYLADNRLAGSFQFGTTVRNIFKYPKMIEEKQWRALEK